MMRSRRYLSIATALVLTLVLVSGLGLSFAGGNGSSSNPYQISNCTELQNMSSDLSANYELINDIDCSNTTEWNGGSGFNPIGDYDNKFTGSFDGNGHVVGDLYIDSDYNVGLFGETGSGADVSDVGVENVDITGLAHVGGLIGRNRGGSVSDSYSTGSVSGSGGGEVGGLIGRNFDSSASVSDSYSHADVSSSTDGNVGGLVGLNDGSVSSCYSTGSVSGGVSVGGLVGYNNGGSVSDSYSTGSVSGDSDVGGLIGGNYGSCSDSFWDTNTSGMTSSAGGTGKTTSEMKDVDTFTNTSTTGLSSPWDFVNNPNDDTANETIWYMGRGDDYPRLMWETDGWVDISLNTSSSFNPGEMINLTGSAMNYPWEDPLNNTTTHIYFNNSHLTDVTTNSSGGYQYNFTAPQTAGSYPLKVNITNQNGVTGENQTNLTVRIDIENQSAVSPQTGTNKLTPQDEVNLSAYIHKNKDNPINQVWAGDIIYYGEGEDPSTSPSGTPISTCQELQDMENNLGGDYYLTQDIDCSDTKNWNGEKGFDPIGSFSGTFNGNGHVISDLYINRGSTESVGLFGETGSGVEVKNIGLENVNITGYEEVGGLIGHNNGGSVFSDSYSTGSVSGSNDVGGLVGQNWGSVSDSYSTGSVSGGVSVGGLVGYNNNGGVSDCYSTGSVSGSGDVGGLVGQNWDSVSDSFWNTETSGQGSSDGGTGLTTEEMQTKSTFTDAGWDFPDTWVMVDGRTYPYLYFEDGLRVKKINLDNSTDRSKSQEWSKVINISNTLGDNASEYNATFYANSTLSNGSTVTQEIPAPTTQFYVEKIDITENLNVSMVNPGQQVKVSGQAKLQPYGDNVTNEDVSIPKLDAPVWELENATYTGTSKSTQDDMSKGMFWSDDGSKLYEIGYYSNAFYEWNCSDSWSLGSCSYTGTSKSTQDGYPGGMFWSDDGSKLYEVGYSGDAFYEYDCSDSWSLGSCSYTGTTLSTQDSVPMGMFWSDDGSKLYEVGRDGHAFYEYSVPTEDTVQTNGTGHYEHTLNAPETLGKQEVSVDITANGTYGSNSKQIEVRGLTFTNFELNDSKSQTDRIMNSEENYSVYLDIHETNGTANWTVDTGNFTLTENNTEYNLTHVSGPTWKTNKVLQAKQDPGTYNATLQINGTSTLNNIQDSTASTQEYTVRAINLTLNRKSTTRSGEPLTVTGNATLQPDGIGVAGETVHLYRNITSGWTQVGTSTLNSTAQYEVNVTTNTAGTHQLKANVTDSDGVIGRTGTVNYNITLNVNQSEATFTESNTSYLDIDQTNKNLNLSTYVTNSTDSNVDTATAEITAPDGTTKTYNLDNETTPDKEQTWSKTIDIETEFSSQMGRYNITYTANTTRGIGSNTANTSFYIQNLSITQTLDDYKVNPGQQITITGNAQIQPDFGPLTNRNISIWIDGTLKNKSMTNNSGHYTENITAPTQPGNYTLKVNATTTQGIYGQNTTHLNAYNLSIQVQNISSVDGGWGTDNVSVFKDQSTDIDLNITDEALLTNSSPSKITDVMLEYEMPGEWTSDSSFNNELNTLSPGDTGTNSPSIDIGKNASVGPKTINITATSDQGITAKENITINVWTRSNAEFTNLADGDVIPRSQDSYKVKAEVYNDINNASLNNISTELFVDASSIGSGLVNESKSTGTVTLNWDLTNESTGSKTVSIGTKNEPSLYINSSSSGVVDSVDISILGVLHKDQFLASSSVYRNNDNTNIAITIEDSQNNPVNDSLIYVKNINGVIGNCKTKSDGSCSVTYNPEDQTTPGNYTIQVNASKENFDTLYFNESIEVRGKLSIQNNVANNTVLERGIKNQLNSSVTNEYSNPANGNVTWKLDGTQVFTGENGEWTPSTSTSKGTYTLTAETNRNYYDDDTSNKTVEIYGLSKVELTPNDCSILPGNTIDLTAQVNDSNTTSPIGNYPVKFTINGSSTTTIVKETTNSTGQAVHQWNPSEGTYSITTEIKDNSTLQYHTSKPTDQSTITIGKKISLDQFEITENDTYRPDFYDPHDTTFKVNLSKTSSTADSEPADNEVVTFTINNTDQVTCTTDSKGYCETNYNPDQASVGQATVRVTTNKTDWDNVNQTDQIIIRGVMDPSIQKPTTGFVHRGTTVNLETTTDTVSGGEVDVPVNWTYRGTQIAQNKTANWTPPVIGTSTGSGTLEVSAGEGYYEEGSDDKSLDIYGYSNVKMLSPENNTKIGYGETPLVSCEVTDSVDRDVENYPVEFIEDGTVFNTTQTDSNGEATATWNVPNEIDTFEVGCRIKDNSTLKYTADTNTSTKIFETKDDVPPNISKVNVPDTVNPNKDVSITFNATDEVGVNTTQVQVEDPTGATTTLTPTQSGNTYTATYSNTGTEGGYSVTISASDESQNSDTVMKSFSVDPGGTITVDPPLKGLDGITQKTGKNFTATATLTINETSTGVNGGKHVNITASTSNTDINFNQTNYNCGNVSNGESCSGEFKVQVGAGAEPSPPSLYAKFTGEWIENGSGNRSSTNTYAEIDIQENSLMEEETGNHSTTINHGTQDKVSFIANSTGNDQLENYEATYIPQTLPSSWINLQNHRESTLQPGNTTTTNISISVPLGNSPGTYTGYLNLSADNIDEEIQREIEVTVPTDTDYEVTSSESATAVVNASGTLKEIPINSTGNVNFTLETNITGSISQYLHADPVPLEKQRTNTLTVTYGNPGFPSSGQYTATVELSSNDYTSISTKNINLNVDVLDFKNHFKTTGNTVDVTPGITQTVEFNVTLGGQIQTQNLSFTVEVGNKTASVSSVTNETGTFTLNFTIPPDIEDARTHDLTLQTTETQKNAVTKTTLPDKYRVPDLTNPEINETTTQNIEPGQNTTVEVSAWDNNPAGVLNGVQNTTLTVESPSGNTSTHHMNISGEKWAYELKNLTEGIYTLNFTATDPTGRKTTKTKKIRVAPYHQINGSFITSKNQSKTAEITIKDIITNHTQQITVTGNYTTSLQPGKYNLNTNFTGNTIKMKNTSIDQNTTNLIKAETLSRLDVLGISSFIPSGAQTVMGIATNTPLQPSNATLTLNYSGYEDEIPNDRGLDEMKLARCKNYSYYDGTCHSDLETFNINLSKIDTDEQTVTATVPGFSVYSLYFPAEDTTDDTDGGDTGGGGGGGGGGAGGAGLTEEQEESISKIPELYNITKEAFSNNFLLQDKKIEVFMNPGESTTASITIKNPYKNTTAFQINQSSSIKQFINTSKVFSIPSLESKDLIVNITIPEETPPEFYSGSLSLHNNATEKELPVFIHLGASASQASRVMHLDLQTQTSRIKPGENISVQVSIDASDFNKEKQANTTIMIQKPGIKKSITEPHSFTKKVKGLNVESIEIQVPENMSFGQYVIYGTLKYQYAGEKHTSSDMKTFIVSVPFLQRTVLGMTVMSILKYLAITTLIAITAYLAILAYRKWMEKERRFEANLYPENLPGKNEPGESGYLGKVADYGMKAYLGLDQIMTHAMVAGATGAGKTVSAQVMVEEALQKGKNIIVLDPTAQWSGFLRDCESNKMMNYYPEFDLTEEDTQSYKGNIRTINSPDQDIDIQYMLQNEEEEGSIVVFSLHKLEQKDIEKFTNSMIQQVFDANLEERDHLDTVIVFDEVHRLLEKFGGTGKGLNHLERGAREFRKWGVGLILISQVISDFPEEVRSNIGTKIQMRTRNQDELEFYMTKFGKDMVRSIVKANVGTGMVQNSEYNKGNPYFVNFRPLKHSPHRLTDEELDKYEEYNEEVNKIEEEVDKLEEEGEDVFDYRSRISLVRKNIRKGSFNLVDIYLDELKDDLE